MPIYEYRCHCCGAEQDVVVNGNPFKAGFKTPESVRCECGLQAYKKEIPSNVSVSVDNEFVTEHLTGKPMLIRSRKHLREELRSRGLRQTHDYFS